MSVDLIHERFTLDGRSCEVLYPADGEGMYSIYLIGSELDRELWDELLRGTAQKILLCTVSADWNSDLTPWDAPALPGRSAFSGGAPKFLEFLMGRLVPHIENAYPAAHGAEQRAIMGYSLAGLFALWTVYTSGTFGTAASLSGSLWYDGWREFAETHSPAPGARVYLSLGKSEERAGNIRMAAVGDSTRVTYKCLKDTLGEENTAMEWNRGGHFTGVQNRWRKAFEWVCAHKSPENRSAESLAALNEVRDMQDGKIPSNPMTVGEFLKKMGE